MVEYVDKQELLQSLEKKIKADNERRMAVVDRDFIDLVNDATVIEDVVEVVRCKRCRYAHFVRSCSKYMCEKGCGELKYSTDFCSYGERKEQRKEDEGK